MMKFDAKPTKVILILLGILIAILIGFSSSANGIGNSVKMGSSQQIPSLETMKNQLAETPVITLKAILFLAQ